MELLPGVRADTAHTDRLRVHDLEAGPSDGWRTTFLEFLRSAS